MFNLMHPKAPGDAPGMGACPGATWPHHRVPFDVFYEYMINPKSYFAESSIASHRSNCVDARAVCAPGQAT